MPVAATHPGEESWNLEDLYPSTADFERARAALESRVRDLDRWKGRIAEGPRIAAEALEAVDDARRELARLRCYASLRSDADIRVSANQALRQQVDTLAAQLQGRTAYLRPELLALPAGSFDRYLREEPRLRPFSFYLTDLDRTRAHVLGPAEERILAESSLMSQSPPSLFQVLHNVDLPRPSVTLRDGSEVRLDPVEFYRRRKTRDRDDRRHMFRAFYGAYESFADTLAQNLLACVRTHLFHARTRRHTSCLAAALHTDNVPERVYHRLIEQVREHLPLLHRFFRLRGEHLGIDDFGYHDLHGPLTDKPPTRYDTETARHTVIEAVRPLGADYGARLREAFGARWIDWHPGHGKRSGAYATGWAYDVHPYVLLNFTGELESVSTLAHEMGHAMHSAYSNDAQPHASSGYSIFVAEVASTLNEALLSRHLLERARNDDERLYLLSRHLDGFRGTLFRQTQFAEFELRVHEAAERGEPLTGESISAAYLELVRAYHGHDEGCVEIDELYRVEWAAIPHFYYDFYVFQYATGIVAATALVQRVLEEGAPAVAAYLDFLRSGGSAYPLEQLRRAGVDLESREPYRAAFAAMERRLDEFEALLAERPRA